MEGVLYLFVRKVIKHIAVNCRGVQLLPTKCRVLCSILLSRFSPYEIMGVTSMDFDVKINYRLGVQHSLCTWKKREHSGAVQHIFRDLKKVCDLVMMHALCNILSCLVYRNVTLPLSSVGKAGTVATGVREWGPEEDNLGTRESNMRLQKIM